MSMQRWLSRVTSGIQEIQSFISFWHLRLLGESLNYEAFSAKTMPSGPFKNSFFFSALHALRWIVQRWLLRLKVVPSFAAEGEPWRWYLLLLLRVNLAGVTFFCLAFLSVQRWLLEGGCLFGNCFAFLSVQRWLLRVAASTDSISLGKPFQGEKFVIYSAGTILCLRSSIAEVPDQSLCNIKCLTECLYTTTPKCWTIPLPIAQVSQVYTCKW